MNTEMKLRRQIHDDYTGGNIPYTDVTTTKVLTSLRSPSDYLQIAYDDDSIDGFVGNSYKSLSLEKEGSVCFTGFTRNLADSFTLTKPSTSVEYHGVHTYNSRANTDAYFTIYNDSYGIHTEGTDDLKKATVQITGFVREQYNRKMILLGNNVNKATIDMDFHPEWYVSKKFEGSSPFTNTPLVPVNTLTDDHSSFLIMDRLGQKFYMSETQQMFQEAKGFRLNVYDTTAMKYEGTYNWGTHRPITLETEIGVDLMPKDKHIIFDIEDKKLKIDLDGEVATGKIVITAGTTTITMTKDGDIDISGSGALNITTSGNVVFQSGTHTIVADGDNVTLGSGHTLTTSTGTITGMFSPFCGLPIPPAAASTSLTLAQLTGGTITTTSTRKEKVE